MDKTMFYTLASHFCNICYLNHMFIIAARVLVLPQQTVTYFNAQHSRGNAGGNYRLS